MIKNFSQPSNMNHSFSKVPSVNAPRSTFGRNYSYKTSLNAGLLVPIYFDLAFPGDTINLKMGVQGRTTALVTPIMDNMYIDMHYFSIPIRLVMDNWQKLMGEQKNPGDSIDYLVPVIESELGGFPLGGLADYFGWPVDAQVPPDVKFRASALWHLAYRMTWNDWYRDQNLQNSVAVDTTDTVKPSSYDQLLPRNKRHDYFTSLLPWPQKGPEALIPTAILGVTAPVVSDNTSPIFKKTTGTAFGNGTMTWDAGGSQFSVTTPSAGNSPVLFDGTNTGLMTDLNDVVIGGTINQLRTAEAVQTLLERDARGGTRYIESNYSHFGVMSDDARMQRPEFLGMHTSDINVNAIPQTSSSDGETPQANLAANGTMLTMGGFSKSFTEHCIVIGLASIRAELNYQNGVDKMFDYRSRYDFYVPALAHLGEQAVTRREIYYSGDDNEDALVFGYGERWSEMRYKKSLITGKMRSTAPQSLDIWHLAQNFTDTVALNSSFIEENPPTARISAVPSEPMFILNAFGKIQHTRVMPTYSVPELGGRI